MKIPAGRLDAIIHWLSSHLPPVMLWGRWDFDSPLDRATLARAVLQLPQRVPALACHYRPGLWRGAFVRSDEPAYAFEHREYKGRLSALAAANDSISLELGQGSGPVFTVRCFAWETGCQLLLALDHRHVDGRGMANVMKALADSYTAAQSPRPVPLEPLSEQRSLAPVLRALRPIHYLRMPIALWRDFVSHARVPLSALSPLGMDGDENAPSRVERPAHAHLHLDSDQAMELHRTAKARSATLNDVLLSAYCVATRRWNERNTSRPQGKLSLIFASDYRRHFANGVRPIANVSAVHRLVLSYEGLDSMDLALPIIKSRVDRMKQRGMALDSLSFLLQGLAIPDGLVAGVIAPVFRSMVRTVRRSVALTNIGALDESVGAFGENVARACTILAPVAPAKALIAAATSYRGALDVTLGFDRAALSTDQSAVFVELYRQALKELRGI
ncbi:MAG: hypothetical protein MUC50_22465 [Myxococcota bacterium]|jgi:NRPS condensation-like uncharacterized protein|nr:hypothetical protein [Myxococcota bacterium]